MTTDTLWPGWKIVRQIGAGSFGKVYEIQQMENGVVKKAALKVMSVPPAQEDVQYIYDSGIANTEQDVSTYIGNQVQTVAQEIHTMVELRWHPNIVGYQAHRIVPHDGWLGADILIRMELLAPLNRYLRDHRLTECEVARMGIDICRALEACQSLNPPVLHRDIKPANIMLNDNGTFKLGDFGVARVMEGTKSAHTRAGTEDYMAPEVLQMKGYFATADIYSLGMVLYRMLNNNRNPFLPLEGIPDVQMQMQARAKRLTGEPIPAPKVGSVELKKVVLKALEYDPAKRYQNAMEFRWALEKCPELADSTKKVVAPVAGGPITVTSAFQQNNSTDGVVLRAKCPAAQEKRMQSEQQEEYDATVFGGAVGNQPKREYSAPVNPHQEYQWSQPAFPGASDGTVLDSERQILGERINQASTGIAAKTWDTPVQPENADSYGKLCKIEFRDGYGNTISRIVLSKGETLIPPRMNNPRFKEWRPEVPKRASTSQVFIAQYDDFGSRENTKPVSSYANNANIKITYIDEDGEYLDAKYYRKGERVEHPYIPKVHQKIDKVFRCWEPDVWKAEKSVVCRACYSSSRPWKKRLFNL